MVQKYILDNGLDATIDNLYKAEYSAGGTGESYSVPSIEENTDFSQLDEQIQKCFKTPDLRLRMKISRTAGGF